jgi:TonB-linked SusC/RagA family outer membrane protein
MKMMIALLLFACLHTYADGFAQKRISIKLESAEMKQALQQIEKKSQYRFLYNQTVLQNTGKVSLSANNELLVTVLNQLFEGTGISYKLLDGELIVLSSADVEAPAPQTVRGKVTDADGKPIPGASVLIKGSKTGTAADAEGNYSISVDEKDVLVISAVGYTTQEIAVMGRSNFNVSLALATAGLNEVVVIGYGTASKRDLTGSIVKIQGKEVADKPNPNPVASLQGKVAGLSVVNSGTPGAEPDIRIRGTVSIGGIRPLYVVDGIWNDNINFLNPNDIESIEVLKDPSSLAIFGARGATGVIAITTKKAKAGQILVNLNTTFGFKKLVDKIEMANAEEFKTLFDEEQTNIGVPANQRFDYTPWKGDTDWIDEMTHTGLFSASNLSVNASSDKNRFYMGIGYTMDEGVVLHEKLQKMMININDEFRLTKNIKVGFTLSGVRQKLPYGAANGLLFDARRVLPITPPTTSVNISADPSKPQFQDYYTELAIQAAQIGNPLMNLNNKWDKELRYENRLVSSVYVDFNFLKNFNWRSTFYVDRSNLDSRGYNPIIYTYNPAVGGQPYVDRNNRTTSVYENAETWSKYQQDHILTYKKNFGDHGLTAMAGFTTYYFGYQGLFATASQSTTGDPIPNDKRFWYIDNGFVDLSTRRSSSGQSERTTVSGLIRALYNYKGKYMLNASFRQDGSSAWRPENDQWQSFYSVGAAWEATKEGFMQNQKIFDYLKVKASWGVLGVQNTYGFAYPAYPALQTGNTAVFGEVIAPAYSLAYNVDPNLRWESVNAIDAGVEFNMLQNRLHVEATYYSKTTEDLLSLVPDGNNRQRLSNIGTLYNKGVELAASYTHSFNKDLTLTVGGNITTFSNEMGDIAFKLTASEERPNQTEAGYPIGYFYGYVVEGIYQSYADKLASPTVVGYEYGPGDFKYKDINGDGKIDATDRTMIGNPTADFIYGANLNLTYKNFDFSVDLNGSYGNEIYRYWGSSELPFTVFNYPKFKMNRWRGEGTSNWDPIIASNRAINRLPSTYGIEDGSYIRLRNIQIGYNFSPQALAKAKIKSFRVFVNAQNLKTWKNNSGYTPEYGGSPTSFGIDNGNGPLPMVVTGGINVNF